MGLNFVTISLDSSYVENQFFGPSRGGVFGTPLGPLFLFFLMWLPVGGDVRGSDHEQEHSSALSDSDDEYDRSSSSSDHDESSSLGGRSAGSSEELENDLRMEGISSGPVVCEEADGLIE